MSIGYQKHFGHYFDLDSVQIHFDSPGFRKYFVLFSAVNQKYFANAEHPNHFEESFDLRLENCSRFALQTYLKKLAGFAVALQRHHG